MSTLEDAVVEELKAPIDIDSEKATPHLVALLFFDYANSTGDGKLNLAGIFDRIFVDREAKQTAPVGVFIRTTETVDSPVRVTIISPENEVAGGFHYKIPRKDMVLPGGQKHIMMQMVASVQFNTPVEGTYWVDVSFNEKSLGGSPLKVEFAETKESKNGTTRGDG